MLFYLSDFIFIFPIHNVFKYIIKNLVLKRYNVLLLAFVLN